MVPELFVEIVEELWSEEKEGACKRVVHPKRITNAIKAKVLRLTKEHLDVHRVSFGLGNQKLCQRCLARVWLVAIRIAKLLEHCHCEW